MVRLLEALGDATGPTEDVSRVVHALYAQHSGGDTAAAAGTDGSAPADADGGGDAEAQSVEEQALVAAVKRVLAGGAVPDAIVAATLGESLELGVGRGRRGRRSGCWRGG